MQNNHTKYSGFNFRESRLVAKVALMIFIGGLGLSIIFAIIAGIALRSYESDRQADRLTELISTVETTVRIACFTNDQSLAEEVARGLITNRLVANVVISSETKLLAEIKRPDYQYDPSALSVIRQVFSPFDQTAKVGNIHIIANHSFINQQINEYSGITIGLLLFEVLACTLVVSWVIMKQVVHPIKNFADNITQIQGGKSDFLHIPLGYEKNEIGELGQSFNELIDTKASLLRKEQLMHEQVAQNELRLRTILDNSPDMIIRYNTECQPMVVNAAYLRETGDNYEQIIHSSLEASKLWGKTKLSPNYYRERLMQVMNSGEPEQILLEWKDHNNNSISHEMLVVAEYDTNYRLLGTLAMGRNVTERKAAEERLAYQAMHDSLTGLPNRSLLKDRINRAMAKSSREGSTTAVILIDLDNFKTINDTLGHDIGDQLLIILSKRMVEVVREIDTVARLGGDEFVVVVQDAASNKDIDEVVYRLYTALSTTCDVEGNQLYPSASIGIALYPKDAQDIESLMRCADTAMYAAKSGGRNNFQYFAESMDMELREWVNINNNLRKAIENNEFLANYQPKCNIFNGELVGMETLIRWKHPEWGMVSPAKFIPIAEKSGLIPVIGLWILEEACRQIKEWLDLGLKVYPVAVNISTVQCQDIELPEKIEFLLKKYNIDGQYLEMEITESAVMSDISMAIKIFSRLREFGIRLAIDDFGTGYSSLSYLKKLPIHNIKIDKSFVDDIETDANDVAIINAIIAMSHSLGLEVTAEGVENVAQLDLLKASGCNTLQGYYYSRPIDAQAMSEFLKNPKKLYG